MELPGALGQLHDKVDAFFAAAEARYPEAMVCKSGCSDCCVPGLSVTSLEAEAIVRYLAGLSPAARGELRARAAREQQPHCVALDPAGRCAIYPVRPLVCRTHGVVIKLPADAGPEDDDPATAGAKRHLPLLDACPNNFKGLELADVDKSAVLDQSTLSTLSFAADRAFGGDGARHSLKDLLSQAGPSPSDRF